MKSGLGASGRELKPWQGRWASTAGIPEKHAVGFGHNTVVGKCMKVGMCVATG